MKTDYLTFHHQLLTRLAEQVAANPPFDGAATDAASNPEAAETLAQLQALSRTEQWNDAFYQQGQQLLCHFIATYPHITPLITRDLLWLFGGDCLHYMPDDEIQLFQRLEDKRADAEAAGTPFHYEKERANVFGLH